MQVCIAMQGCNYLYNGAAPASQHEEQTMQDMQEEAETAQDQPETEAAGSDTKADVWAILVMFTAALLMAMHFVSGFTFDL